MSMDSPTAYYPVVFSVPQSHDTMALPANPILPITTPRGLATMATAHLPVQCPVELGMSLHAHGLPSKNDLGASFKYTVDSYAICFIMNTIYELDRMRLSSFFPYCFSEGLESITVVPAL